MNCPTCDTPMEEVGSGVRPVQWCSECGTLRRVATEVQAGHQTRVIEYEDVRRPNRAFNGEGV